MNLKKAGMILLLASLMLMAGCKDKEGSSGSSTPPATVTAAPETVSALVDERVMAAVVSGATAGLNVRDAASTSGNILGEVQNGAKLQLLNEEKMSDFYQVSYQGKTAYVHSDYVELERVPVAQLTETATSTPSPEATNPTSELDTSQNADTTPSPSPTPTASPESSLVVNRDGES